MAKFIDIREFLEERGVNFKIIELSGVARSVEDVLRLSNNTINEDEIIKTLIAKDKSGKFVGCILRGGDRLKNSLIDRLATKDEVVKIAGVEFGAVCPILLGVPIMIDEKVTRLKRVNMGSGDLLCGLEMNFKDFTSVLSDYRIDELV